MNDPAPTAFVLLAATMACISIWVMRSWARVWLQRKAVPNFRALAERLGLKFVSVEPETALATGILRGKPVELFAYTAPVPRGGWLSWAAVSARATDTAKLTFVLNGEGNYFPQLDRFNRMFCRPRLTTGDSLFDAKWVIVSSNSPEFFAAALIPELRAKLMASHAVGARGSFQLENGVVRSAEVGRFSDTKRCARFPALAGIVCDLADIVEVAPVSGDTQRKT